MVELERRELEVLGQTRNGIVPDRVRVSFSPPYLLRHPKSFLK